MTYSQEQSSQGQFLQFINIQDVPQREATLVLSSKHPLSLPLFPTPPSIQPHQFLYVGHCSVVSLTQLLHTLKTGTENKHSVSCTQYQERTTPSMAVHAHVHMYIVYIRYVLVGYVYVYVHVCMLTLHMGTIYSLYRYNVHLYISVYVL